MKPHRRKQTPPRRGSSAHSGERTASEGPSMAEEKPSNPDPGIGGYDPGRALVEEGEKPAAHSAPAQDPGRPQVDAPPPPASPSAPVSHGAGIYDDPPAAPVQQARPPRKRPAGKRPGKKAAPRAGSTRRPTTPPGRRPPPRRSNPSYGGGVSVLTIFLALVALGMAGVIVMVLLPREMDGIQGYPVNPITDGGEPRNLLKEAQEVMLGDADRATISEEEVNRYLNHRLEGTQEGAMGPLLAFKGLYVDFEPGTAEFVIEREMFGQRLTMSSRVRPEDFRGRILYRPDGWTVGRIELGGSRTIQPIRDLFVRLRQACGDEYQALQRMGEVRFEDDRLVLGAVR